MTSKAKILTAIRGNQLPEAPLPELASPGIRFDNPLEQFRQTLASVGGRAVTVQGAGQLEDAWRQLGQELKATRTCSIVEGVTGSVELEELESPHQLEDIEVALAAGQFGVAENGAIWVTDEGVRHRVIYFLPQHLALVIPASDIVHNMHDAYARLAFTGAGFGAFISGPSKTADIEQSLVIGAHGARSLTVFLQE